MYFRNAFKEWTIWEELPLSITKNWKKHEYEILGVCTIELLEVTLTLIPIIITNAKPHKKRKNY